MNNSKTNSNDNKQQKLFYGLFVFPLLIAALMTIFLSVVVFMTAEPNTLEHLIKGIKTSEPSKRWQKAYELANEMNKVAPQKLAQDAELTKTLCTILDDKAAYDQKTRSYVALALGRVRNDFAYTSLVRALDDSSDEVGVYSLWALGLQADNRAAPLIVERLPRYESDKLSTAIYVLGAFEDARYSDTVASYLKSADPDVQWNSALSLARMKDMRALETLIRMMDRQYVDQMILQKAPDTDKIALEKKADAVILNAAKGLALIPDSKSTKILASVLKSESSIEIKQQILATKESIEKKLI